MTSYAPILALARAGATQPAWDAFIAAGLDRVNEVDALTLMGRLLKDRARLAAGVDRLALFAQSAASYERAAALRPDSYPLINAAAMSLFAGDRVRSELLASKVLHLIESGADAGETPYWGEATRSEALLLLRRKTDAEASLAKAVNLAPQAWEDHAATLRQMAAILAYVGDNPDWLDSYRPAPCLHFSGIMGIDGNDKNSVQSISNVLAEIKPGFGFGALAAGADIIIAEMLVKAGAGLHVVLPSEPDDFRRSSVEPSGQDWVTRFDHLIETAQSVTICGNGEPTSTATVKLAEYHAMGRAVEFATQLETRATALRVGAFDRPRNDDPWLLSKRAIHYVDVPVSLEKLPEPLPLADLKFELIIDGDASQCFASLSDSIETLSRAGDAIAAVDCQIDGAPTHVRALLARGAPGMIVATRDAALAMLASGITTSVEPVGEMATAAGPVGICITRLSQTQV